jgi:hypothetical protein
MRLLLKLSSNKRQDFKANSNSAGIMGIVKIAETYTFKGRKHSRSLNEIPL